MKNREKISIIGGGFSGCVSAFILAESGYKVTLYEKGDKLGGTSKDLVYKDEKFFNGPHYFNPNSDWMKRLLSYREFNNEFKILDSKVINSQQYNIYRSYTDLFGKKQFNNLFAQPVTSFEFKKIFKNKGSSSLIKRLNLYQSNISKPLIEWCKSISKIADKLHFSCAERLNIGRICFINDIEYLKKIKKSNEKADQILGVPMKSKENQKYCYAKNGNDSFYKKFEKVLKKRVKINFNSIIKISKHNKKKFQILENNKVLKADKFIWAANPVNLIKTLGYGDLDNPVTRIKIFCSNIDILKNKSFENFYIQVFSSKSNIFRIYIYKLGKKHKITVETYYNKKFENLNQKELNKILACFDVKIKIKHPFYEKKEVRHNLLTNKDYKKLKEFDKDFNYTNLVGGGWFLRGRENKLNHIVKKFKNL